MQLITEQLSTEQLISGQLITEQGYTSREAANNLAVSLSAITRRVRAETQKESKLCAKRSTLNISESAEREILRKEKTVKMKRNILKKQR